MEKIISVKIKNPNNLLNTLTYIESLKHLNNLFVNEKNEVSFTLYNKDKPYKIIYLENDTYYLDLTNLIRVIKAGEQEKIKNKIEKYIF